MAALLCLLLFGLLSMSSVRIQAHFRLVIPLVAACALTLATLHASTRYVFEGYLSGGGDVADYRLSRGFAGTDLAGIDDPDGLLDARVGQRVRFTAEMTAACSASDVPIVRVLSVESPAWAAPSGRASGVDPARWAGADNGLFPSLEEPLPRYFAGVGGGGTPPTDTDGDGVPDSSDDFPDDPAEWLDTDGDGVGNNADNDDDDDGMTDPYELMFGLNPLVDDAAGDLDTDRSLNGEEFVAGTAANDATSWFRARTTHLGADLWRIGWEVRPGRLYDLFVSYDGLTFSPVHTDLRPVSGQTTMSFKFTPPEDRLPEMFRVRVRLESNP